MNRPAGMLLILLPILASDCVKATGVEGRDGGSAVKMNKLTPEEEKVIVNKGTERPFSGKYVNHHADGTYTCKRCGARLFNSNAKFDSRSGWPSFDEAIPGAVKKIPDPDGERTEIVCAQCNAHLGHIFTGEGLTSRDARFCVNSTSLDFAPAPKIEHAYFAGGCFWGIEYMMDKAPGVISAESGYMGGKGNNPTYGQVCTGETGYLETVHVSFDAGKTTYEELAKLFFEIHDPTQKNGQGPDIGEQYKSAVFYTSDDQYNTLNKLIDTLKARGYQVATRLLPATTRFWKAEDYHQDYYEKKGSEPYCHARVKRFGD